MRCSFKSGFILGLSPVGERVTILKFNSPLHFANVSKFTSAVSELYTDGREASASPTTISSEKPIVKSNEYIAASLGENNEKRRDSFDSVKEALYKEQKTVIILDCSAIAYVDTMGVDALREVDEIANNFLQHFRHIWMGKRPELPFYSLTLPNRC